MFCYLIFLVLLVKCKRECYDTREIRSPRLMHKLEICVINLICVSRCLDGISIKSYIIKEAAKLSSSQAIFSPPNLARIEMSKYHRQ